LTDGPEFVKDDFAGVITEASGEFSEPVVISFKGTDFDTNCIFDDTFLEYSADGTPVNSKYSRATFEDNRLTEILGEKVLDTEIEPTLRLLIRGILFVGHEFERDGQGLLLMNLKKA